MERNGNFQYHKIIITRIHAKNKRIYLYNQSYLYLTNSTGEKSESRKRSLQFRSSLRISFGNIQEILEGLKVVIPEYDYKNNVQLVFL